MGQSNLAQAETASRWKALHGAKQASTNPACIAIGLPDTPYWVSYEPIP